MLFHAPKTLFSDVITTHTEMRYCCCILSPQTIYTLSQFFHLSLENDVTATLKRFLKPFLLTFILKWILIQFCPKKSRSKTNKWHPQSVNTGFHIILRQVIRLAIKTITWDNPDNAEELLWANRSQSGAIVKTVVNLQFFLRNHSQTIVLLYSKIIYI